VTPDEQLIAEVRASLRRVVADTHPSADLYERVMADRSDGPRHRAAWRVGLGSGARTFPALATVVTALVVVALALVLLGHGGGGTDAGRAGDGASGGGPGSPVTVAAPGGRAHDAAVRAVLRTNRSPACDFHLPDSRPRPRIGTVVPRALSGELTVLRRAQRPGDLQPKLVRDSLGSNNARVIFYDGMRLARTVDGDRLYLLPVMTRDFQSLRALGRCAGAERVALAHESLPTAERASARRALAAFIDQRDYDARAHPAVCELNADSRVHGTSSECSATARLIARAGTLDQSSPPLLASGVVPDGVASVTVTFAAAHGRRIARSGRVVGNEFAVNPPSSTRLPFTHGRRFRDPIQDPGLTIAWRNAAGRVIRRVSAAAASSVG
jgi:hypothetical protein